MTRILVQEGAPVKAGQRLILFETEATAAETQARRAQAEQAREQLRQVRSGPRRDEIHRQEAVVAELEATLAALP